MAKPPVVSIWGADASLLDRFSDSLASAHAASGQRVLKLKLSSSPAALLPQQILDFRGLDQEMLRNYFFSGPCGFSSASFNPAAGTHDNLLKDVCSLVMAAFERVIFVGDAALDDAALPLIDASGQLLWIGAESDAESFQKLVIRLTAVHFPTVYCHALCIDCKPSAAPFVFSNGVRALAMIPNEMRFPARAKQALHDALALLDDPARSRTLQKTGVIDEGLTARAAEGIRRKIEPQLLEAIKGQSQLGESFTQETVEAYMASDKALPDEREARDRILSRVMDDVMGLGPIESLLKDPTVTEVMINGRSNVFVERGGKLLETNVQFTSDEQLKTVIDRIVAPIGRRVDESMPLCDARLKDGSRVNVIIPPLALDGATVTIRKFPVRTLSLEDLLEKGSLSKDMMTLLSRYVSGKRNIVVSGGTGSGKTTLLNALSSAIPDDERIVTIEDAAELRLQKPHVVRLESRPPNAEGQGTVTIRRLVMNALRMRPDRIVVGECRGGEALDMLQAMNTGHDGSMTTVHANSPRDALSRLETLVLMAGVDLPIRVVREQIRSAVNLIVQQARLSTGARKIIAITELTGMEGDTLITQDLFIWRDGTHVATGIMPLLSASGART